MQRLEAKDPNAIMVHTPVQTRWLNQIEIYFSIIQRKVLTPNDFRSLAAVEERLTQCEQLHNAHPTPFHWKFDREQLNDFMTRLNKQRGARGEPPLDMAEQPVEMTAQPLDMAA